MTLALAGAAHALTVDIIVPETDPAEVYPQVRVRFLAEARDEKGNDVSDRAAFSWAFSDAEDSTVGNPVLHRFPKVGKFLVSVTATLDSDSGCDETTVVVIPYEGGGLRQAPGVGDFTFTANGHTPPAEVSDDVSLLVEQVGDIEPFWWVGTEFQRYQNGQWVAPEDQLGTEEYAWITLLDYPQKNGPVPWRARVMLDEIGADPPHGMDLYVTGTWAVVNTVVKSASPPLIIHHAEDTSHTIAWDLTHCADFDPTFTMTVTIYDVEGTTVATLVRNNVPLEEENPQIVWDTDLPEEDGIYTYKIQASHNRDPMALYPCTDLDKSQALSISVEHVYRIRYDAQAHMLDALVVYTLTRDASAVKIEFYGAKPNPEEGDLEPLAELTGQSGRKGENWSDAVSIPVRDDGNGEPMTPLYCVVLASESGEDGARNRDLQPKPALPRGTTDLEAPPFDLHIDRATEQNEETLGAFVLLNNDDDDGSDEIDLADPQPIEEENDLKRVIVMWNPAEVTDGTLRLTCTAGSAKIGGVLYGNGSLWGPISLPKNIDPSTEVPPAVFWVHGEELSAAPRDVVFELKWLREGIPDQLVDTVKVTVWDAEISDCGAQWLPSGTPDDPMTLSFTCTILPEGVVGLTQFSLNSSTMPGYCMNAPLEVDPLASPLDLCFTPGQNGFDSGYREEDPLLWQTATTTQPVSEAEIEVQCQDYGAWGWLQAQVRVGDTLDRAHAPGDDLKTVLTIPIDEDGNRIADCWDYNEGAATDDEESLEDMGDPNYPGDGLTRYEEYRGFMALGQHIRTNPDDGQDIFLIDKDDLGAGFFANSGLTLQFISLTEVGIDPVTREPQAVNFNCGFAHAMGQHAVIYLDAGYHPDWYGDSGYVGVPSLFPGIAVQIWVAAVRYDSPPTLNDPDTPDATDADALATVIAHELGHRVAIRHHDPVAAGDDDCIMISGADPRWYDPRSIFCTETIPDNPGTPEEVETGDCLHKWRLHD